MNNSGFTPNKLIECPEPGILFTRSNAAWAYHALKAVRESGQSIPEQDELCDELAGILFPPPVAAAPARPDPLVPGEDGLVEPDDDRAGSGAASLLPTGELMNPARPESARFYDRDQMAYIVSSPAGNALYHTRVLTSFGRLAGWGIGTEHRIRHDQTWYPLGSWLVTGIRNCKTGWQAGNIPDRPLHHWVFK